nr:immunoglobulin heavy chain junction region [Macaca mulatta]
CARAECTGGVCYFDFW